MTLELADSLAVALHVISGLICLVCLLISLRFFRPIWDNSAYQKFSQAVNTSASMREVQEALGECVKHNRQVTRLLAIFRMLFALTLLNFFMISVVSSQWYSIVIAIAWPSTIMACLWLLRAK